MSDLVIDPENWRGDLLELILRFGVLLGLVVYLPSVVLVISAGLGGIAVIDTVAMATVVGLFYWKSLHIRWRATVFCFIVYGLGITLLIGVGPISQIYLFAFSILATLLLGLRMGLYAAVLSSMTMLLVGYLGSVAPAMLVTPWSRDYHGWLVVTLNFTVINTLLTLAIGAMLAAVDNALSRALAARTSLQREHRLLRTLIDALPDVVFTKDTSGRFVLCNPAAVALVGLEREEQLAGKTVFDLFPGAMAEQYHADDLLVLTGRPLLNREEQCVSARGTPLWYLTIKVPLRDPAGTIIGLIGISRDITERKKLEEQLRQSQKMEAVGKLAGGVAHDFNNLITIISGYSELLLAEPRPSASMRVAVEAISQAGDRAAALTRQLLAFSRRTILQPRILDLNAVVAETGKLLRRLISEDIEFNTVLAPNLARVRVDPGQLDQVLMNLVINARDAMPRGGKLTIATASSELSHEFAISNPDCQAGPHVMLAITDTGCGMTQEVRDRIFEPFFTTKAAGKGTGLGLAVAFGVVRQSGGCIEVFSEPGRGSTFKIYFPAVADPVSKTNGAAPTGGLDGCETILLVEDEDGVRDMALVSLQLHGYTVLTAKDGKDALRVVEAHRGAIDILVTDVVMPNINGLELAEVICERYPRMKVLFTSGYTDDAVVRHGVLQAEVAFLQKPYRPVGLVQKVRQVLDEQVNRPVAPPVV